jgi:L-lactate utilization protein LutC
MNARDSFLHRVRQAVLEGNRAGAAAALPERGQVGYQGGGADPAERFCAELTAAGGAAYRVHERSEVVHKVRELLAAHGARKVLIGVGGLIERLSLAAELDRAGFELTSPQDVRAGAWREPFFAADAGVSNATHLIAETGSVVMAAQPDEPRSVSLLPPLHIVLAQRSQILPDLFDLFDLYAGLEDGARRSNELPSCLTVITGPSKTGDIELKLVTGVHGPGEIHVIVWSNEKPR